MSLPSTEPLEFSHEFRTATYLKHIVFVSALFLLLITPILWTISVWLAVPVFIMGASMWFSVVHEYWKVGVWATSEGLRYYSHSGFPSLSMGVPHPNSELPLIPWNEVSHVELRGVQAKGYVLTIVKRDGKTVPVHELLVVTRMFGPYQDTRVGRIARELNALIEERTGNPTPKPGPHPNGDTDLIVVNWDGTKPEPWKKTIPMFVFGVLLAVFVLVVLVADYVWFTLPNVE